MLLACLLDQPMQQIPLFTMQDMRFFQYFLVHTVPSHPIGNERIWTHEIPCLSHNVRISFDKVIHTADPFRQLSQLLIYCTVCTY